MSTNLADRVEGLDGPDEALDVLIIQTLYPDIGPCQPLCAGETPIFWHDPYCKMPCPRLTESIDAVVALIEKELPGWGWSVTSRRPGVSYACVTEPEAVVETVRGEASSHALALLAALLRAKGGE